MSISQLFHDPNCLPPVDPHQKVLNSSVASASGRAAYQLGCAWYYETASGFALQAYASCAVVGNGGASIREPRGGAAIDRHEAVFRSNFAQTAGYEGFVGSKTTIRIGNHITTRAFDEVIRRSTQPNARLALNAKGWNCDEFIQWPSRYPASIMSLCNVMHDPPFYVMRSTFVREMREMYVEICTLLLDRPKCVPPLRRFLSLGRRTAICVLHV